MVQTLNRELFVDPFFDSAINEIFLNPDKSAYLMDGPIGLGKSSQFLIRTAYATSTLVTPHMVNNRMVRESNWLAVRESGASAVATIEQLLESLFSYQVLGRDDSPIKKYGSHPTYIEIKHKLPDDTYLKMVIECHGFNDEKSLGRLKTREFMGGIVPELQTIPYAIFETIIERCGRWRSDETSISKVIDGKTYTLSGVQKLCTVLGDINIPKRDHPLYANYYDLGVNERKESEILMLTPPPALLHKNVNDADPEKIKGLLKSGLGKVTRFEGKDTVWYPNPAVYNMTRHYEEKDENGEKIAWSGYKYWLSRLGRTDSYVRRFIIGIPDTVGGQAAVYKTFNRESMVVSKPLIKSNEVWIGFDPGGSAAVEFLQYDVDNKSVHFFKEFTTDSTEGISTRALFSNFVFPYCTRELKGFTIKIVPDPAATVLGKNVSAGATESLLFQLRDEITKEMLNNNGVDYQIVPCMVPNQMTDVRIDSLGYMIEQAKCTVDPDCDKLIEGLCGGYKYVELKSGAISDKIDKYNPFSHSVEAAQYPVVNILRLIRKNDKRKTDKGRKVYRIQHSRS